MTRGRTAWLEAIEGQKSAMVKHLVALVQRTSILVFIASLAGAGTLLLATYSSTYSAGQSLGEMWSGLSDAGAL